MKAEIGENVGSDLVAYISALQKEVKELEEDDKEWDIENSRLVSENVKQAKEIKELKAKVYEPHLDNGFRYNELLQEIKELKKENEKAYKAGSEALHIGSVSGSSLSEDEVRRIAAELTNKVPDKIHRSDMNDMEHIKANLKAAIILQLRKMNYR